MPHGWAKQAMTIGFDFERESFRAVLELFERMELVDTIYEGAESPTKTRQPKK